MRRRGAIITAALLVVASLRVSAGAQEVGGEEGPVVIGQRRQLETFHFDRPNLYLDLTGSYSRGRIRSGNVATSFQEEFFRERLDAETRGYYIHPNFLDIKLAGGFGLSQTFSENTQEIDEVYNWDTSATLLRNGDYPLTVFSTRDQSWIHREFGGTLEQTSMNTGVGLDIKRGSIPTHFDYSHLETDQHSVTGFEEFGYIRDAFNWFSSTNFSNNQTLSWNYSIERVHETGVIAEDFTDQNATLRHEYTFGQRDRSRLTSTLNYSSTTGNVDNQRFRWDERLFLHHSDTLDTRYQYTFEDFSFSGNDRTSNRGTAGFTHYLFKSLTTNGNAGVQIADSEGSKTTDEFADITWNYTKAVPYGQLGASLGFGWAHSDSTGIGTVTQVLDQPANFVDPLPIVLSGPNINPNTIVLTDPSGLIIYRPGVDYTVQSLPDRVQISRIIGGALGAGSPVLIDYQLNPLPANETTTTSWTTGLRYDFEKGIFRGLGMYGQYTQVDQSISSDQPSAFVPDSFTDFLYGLEYRFWYVTLGYEHQMHDSEINPFDADRIFARYVQRIGLDTDLSLATGYTTIKYDEPPDKVDLYTASLSLTHYFNRELYGIVTMLYRDEKRQIGEDSWGLEQQIELQWHHRQTRIYMLVRNSLLDSNSQDNSYQFFEVGYRRQF